MNESSSLDDQVVAALRRIARAIDLHSRELLHQCGLTAPQLLTMRAVVRLEPVAVTALAAAVCVSQATMTGILDRLEHQNFIVRNRDQSDRRNMLVRLDSRGRQIPAGGPLDSARSLQFRAFATPSG